MYRLRLAHRPSLKGSAMAATYKAIGWNRHKRIYDVVAVIGIIVFIGVYLGLNAMLNPGAANTSPEIQIISALGACAFFMLHVVLSIGPLARLSQSFLPLLYNRRHLGVLLFIVAAAHGIFAIIWYHGFGVENPLLSIFRVNPDNTGIGGFPYETLGFFALLILFLLAATSHDFWLNNLSPGFWKTIHMLVYPAYGLLVLHVVLGAARQDGQFGAYAWAVTGGAIWIAGLHLLTALIEWNRDGASDRKAVDGWIDVGRWADIPEKRARIVSTAGGEKIAVFRYDNRVSAVSNVCRHQMGPLGEGRVIDGCITCPWHGWQYNPSDGRSPPPFVEKVATFRTRIVGETVYVEPKAQAPGTPVEPAWIKKAGARS